MDAAHLEVVAVPFVNHAMAHNGIRFVQRIVLTAPDAGGPHSAAAALLDVVVDARLVDHRGVLVSRPWQHHADRIEPGERLVIDHPAIELDPAAVLGVEEEVGADLVVTATAAGTEVVGSRTPIRMLAARQWLIDPTAPVLSLELLAAFVQPNHPALGPLTAQTAERLERDTGSGSLAVSSVLPGRVDAVVAAACAVVHDLGVYYAEPPASWGYGQQVRTPGDVVEHHIGTCLDTTVLLASLLEHLGVHPVLWLAQGHAFLGYWRQADTGLPDAASFEVAAAANAVGLGLMGVLETTMLTRERRPPRDLFRRISQAPTDSYLHGNPGALVGVVDVHLSRLLHVRPLPARLTRPDGVVEVVEYRPAEPDAGSGPTSRRVGAALAGAGGGTDPTGMPGGGRDGIPAAGPTPARPDPPPRVQVWKNALLDLTLRNRLLNFGRGVTQLPLLMPGEQLGVLADLLEDRRPVSLRAVDDLAGAVLGREARDAYALPADVQRTMLRDKATVFMAADTDTHKALVARLRYRARTGLQETGANPLALTLGRVDWRLGERDLSAPLLLAPVELTGVIQPYKVRADETGAITLNLSLLEKWRLEFGFTVPGLDELPRRPAGGPGEGGVDVDEVVRRVRAAILEAGLPFTVHTEARLAIVGFTGYLLWRDLDEHWETFLRRPVARHLALTPTDRFVEPAAAAVDTSVAALDEVVAAAPIPADGSQAEAVAAARAGRTFVLEGPPGTGKSQTITNILADQMRAGRRVLFVAEKGAALDVVRRRLVDIGLSPFALDLHDEHASPTVVRAQLKAALAQLPHPDEDGHRVAAGEVSASARALASYVDRLHRPGPAGLSAYAGHAQLLALGTGPVAPVPADWAGADPADLAAARRAVVESTSLLSGLGAGACAAWGFAEVMPAERLGIGGLAGLVGAADRAVADLSDRLGGAHESQRAAVAVATTPRDLDCVAWLLTDDATPTTVLAEARTRRWREARTELTARTEALRAKAAPTLAQFAPEAFDLPLEPVRQTVREAAASFVFGRKGRLVRAAAPLLAHARPGVRVPPKTLPVLVEAVAGLAAEADDLASSWRSLPGLGSLPQGSSILAPASAAALAAALAGVDRDLALLDSLPASARSALERARAEAGPLVDQAAAAARSAAAAIGSVCAAVCAPAYAAEGPAEVSGSSDVPVRDWAGSRGLVGTWVAGAATRSADVQGALLRRWVDAVRTLEPVRLVHLPAARWSLLSGELAPADAPAALDRGIAAAAVRERFQAGALTDFDPAGHERVVDRFVASSETLRRGLRGILPARVVAERPFAPGAWFGTVAALEREVSRTRGGLSVRGLVQTYGEVIAELTPCLLVSPDSLARFVPPGAIDFDLVVFDEASQITVADAMGALGRARAAVIAGDSKQMPPSSFGELSAPDLEARLDLAPTGRPAATPSAAGTDGQAATDAEPDAEAAADFHLVPDEESILSELVHAGVERLWLSWHYRSQDESLIVFSNAHYYDDRLSSFPAFPGQTQDTGLSFTRVAGAFLRSGRPGAGTLRTNPVEAAAVVDEVLRRWRAGERSIGVVTFNLQQRTLIERMLWDSGVEGVAESLAAGRDGLFVKNLENVQGDERDVILFSTGFSATASGVLPLNFGPLNRAGGERRLNVAVTRARRRVMVFCSFEPEDVRVEQTASVGIRHLRDYLELAKYGTQRAPTPQTGGAAEDSVATLQAAGRVRHETVDRHREEIAAALRATGFTVDTALGLSEFRVDLAVGRPGARPVVAVLLDGPPWAARRTTADRDGLPRTVLREVMGWPEVLRVWLPEWLADRQGVLARIRESVERAESAPRRVAGRVVTTAYAATPADAAPGPAQDAVPGSPQDALPDSPQDAPAGDVVAATAAPTSEYAVGTPPAAGAVTPDATGDGTLPFVPFVPTVHGGPSVLDGATRHGRHTTQVQRVIRAVVATEGPVSLDRALLLTTRCFGMTRPPAYRLAELRSIVPTDLRRDPEEGFLWPDTRDPLQWEGFRTWAGTLRDRPLEEIALREIANAAAGITRSAMGIGSEELLRQMLRVFNGTRLTDAPRTRLTAALRVAEQRGQLRVTGGVVTPGPGRSEANVR